MPRFYMTIRGAIFLLLYLSFFAIGCGKRDTIKPEVSERELLVVSTETFQPSTSGAQTLLFSGRVRPAKATELGFVRGGRVTELTVDDGMIISTGQLLGRLEINSLKAREQELRADLAQARAGTREVEAPPRTFEKRAAQDRVTELRSEQKLAESKWKRRQALYKKGAIPQEQLDESATEVNRLKSRLKAAQNQVNDLQAGARPETKRVARSRETQILASLQSLEVDYKDSELRAPYRGKIAKRLVDEGAIVTAGQSIYQLITDHALEAEIFLPPSQADSLSVGDQLDVEVEGQTYKAVLKKHLPTVDTESGTVGLLLTIPSSDKLKSGQLVRLKMATTEVDNGYWLPSTALLPGERGLFVCYTVQAKDGSSDVFIVKKQAVEVLTTTGERAFVRGTLVGNPQVITDGVQRVVPGQKVRRS